MSERGIEYKVGLLIVGAIGICAALIISLGNFSFGSGYTMYVDFSFSGNIQPGAPVKVSGIKVGSVEDVRLQPAVIDEATQRRVMVRLEVWVEDRVKDSIRQDAEFFINTSGVLGEQYLEIVPGDDFERPAVEAGAVLRGVDPPRTDLIVSRLFVVLDSLSSVLTEERDVIGNLLRNGAETVEEMAALLRDNRQELGELVAGATDLANEASQTLEEVNEGIDPALVGRTVRNANALLVTANGTLGQITPDAKALLNDATRVTKLVTKERMDQALSVADGALSATGKASKLLENINGLVTDLRKGKGTAGALLARDEIYADLREMIRDLKRNPWKFFWKE